MGNKESSREYNEGKETITRVSEVGSTDSTPSLLKIVAYNGNNLKNK